MSDRDNGLILFEGSEVAPTLPQNTFDAPYDEEMERAVIGSVLINPTVMDTLDIDANDFFILRHRYIWEAFQRLHKHNEPIERMTARRQLQDMGYYEAIGGDVYLSELINSTSSAMYARPYAELIKRDALRRRVMVMSDEIRSIATDRDRSVEEVIADVYEKADSVGTSYQTDTMKSTRQLYAEMMDALERKSPGLIATGIPRLNENMGGGMRRGNISLFAAPTGTGKTWFAINTMIAVAAQKRTDGRKQKIMYFTMEMTTDTEFNPRVLSIMSGLTVDECTSPGSIRTDERRKKYVETLNEFFNYDVLVDEKTSISPAYVRGKIAQHKPDLVIIDYLQMMRGDGYYKGNRHRELSDIIDALKTIAKESAPADNEKCAIMLLAQLNNEGIKHSRENNEPPTMEAIKESGDIGNYLGHAVMLWQPPQLKDDNLIVCAVRKNRFSPDEYAGKWRKSPPIYKKITGGRLVPQPAMELSVLLKAGEKDES